MAMVAQLSTAGRRAGRSAVGMRRQVALRVPSATPALQRSARLLGTFALRPGVVSLQGGGVQVSRCCGAQHRSYVPSGMGPLEVYQGMCRSGEIVEDSAQIFAMKKLTDVHNNTVNYVPTEAPTPKRQAPKAQQGGGWFGRAFGRRPAPKPKKPKAPPRLVPTGPRGVYLYGGCGTGKSFIMDMFYDNSPVERKKRAHFHEWMIDVHDRLHQMQQSSTRDASADDLVERVAEEMLKEAWLLCFDEFQVTHISDAIIMKRIFSVLFQKGAVVVATSNRPPEDLYLNGLNRPLFEPFIPMLEDFCEVHCMDSDVDYRLTHTEEDDNRVFIHPNNKPEQKLLERKFYRMACNQIWSGAQVEAQGRRIVVPKAAQGSAVAWFKFTDLCDKPLGAADYLAICSAFHTIFVADIPVMTLQERDQVRRFITLVDTLYERHAKLVCTAADDPYKLFVVSEADKQNTTFDEIFAWDRTVSRLIEMQSVKYLTQVMRTVDSEDFMNQYDMRTLSDEETMDLWRRYDADDSGDMDRDEFRVMLQDIQEKQTGHRHLSDEVFDICMQQIDLDGDGTIQLSEFQHYMNDYRTIQSNMKL